MKIFNRISSPFIQLMSFSFLLLGNDKIMGPLILWLIVNSTTYTNFLTSSLFGFICILLLLFIIIFNLKEKILIQFVTSILMITFASFGAPLFYLKNYILNRNLSNIDLIIASTSFLFFLLVNFSVLFKVISFYISKRRVRTSKVE
jgi:hypothetical protein